MSDEQIMKDIVDQDFARVEAKLSNGGCGDPKVHGEALLLITRHIRPIIARSTVTEDECRQRRKDCPGSKVIVQQPCQNTQPALAAVIARAAGQVSPWIVLVGYIIAKKEGWM